MSTSSPQLINPLKDFNPKDFAIIITCADGLENALLIELEGFGLAGEILRAGRVQVRVSLEKFYQLCLYGRVASRILLPIGEYHFKQRTQTVNQVSKDAQGQKRTRTLEMVEIDEDVPEALYRFASRYDWTALFGVEHTFAIRLSTDKRLTVNQQFATLRLKDAIADTFNTKLGKRPDVDAKAPQFAIFAAANQKFAELYLDLSGTSLHRRGYRVANTAAPLKENLAAALLYQAGWHTGRHDALVDVMCGSGTFITEALLMRANYPTGLEKATAEFGFYHWAYHDDELWTQMVAQATADFHANVASMVAKPITVIATDADAGAVHACHRNLMASGLGELVSYVCLQQRALSSVKPLLLERLSDKATNPLFITNPPYGERLGESDFIKPLYQGLGLVVADVVRTLGISADLAILASHVEQADTLPISDPTTLKCHNGALTVYFRYGQINPSHKPSLIERFEKQSIDKPDAQEFINRLQKNLAHLKKLAKSQNVTNLRAYDADLPNFNVAIDIYGDKVHVQEYAPPKQIPQDVAKSRFNLVLASVREVLGVSKEDVFIKTRARQQGNEQYTKNPNSSTKAKKMWLAKEHGAYLYVNFTDYLDTGLFIDHRNMRQILRDVSRGKRALNLFAYTCTASVHMALGGAKSVTSVDLSANYLDWGKQNFALNGLVLDGDDSAYRFIASDVFEWIKEHTEQYDVIFIDPPTFSNSKKFKGTFDVQRDHAALINRAMNRLANDGVLYFSNNYTRFELDESLCQRYDVVEMTDKTIGFDFDVKKPIHQSFMIRHKNGACTTADTQDGHAVSVGGHSSKPHSDFDSKKWHGDDKPSRTDHKAAYRPSHKPNDKGANKGIKGVGKSGDKAKTYGKPSNQNPKAPNKFAKSHANHSQRRDDKRWASTEQNTKSENTIKKRYDLVDGKMVVTQVIDEVVPAPKKYQVKKRDGLNATRSSDFQKFTGKK